MLGCTTSKNTVQGARARVSIRTQPGVTDSRLQAGHFGRTFSLGHFLSSRAHQGKQSNNERTYGRPRGNEQLGVGIIHYWQWEAKSGASHRRLQVPFHTPTPWREELRSLEVSGPGRNWTAHISILQAKKLQSLVSFGLGCYFEAICFGLGGHNLVMLRADFWLCAQESSWEVLRRS